ncbi:MAG: hypothetical protein QM820_00590 [Minicystis sp.]
MSTGGADNAPASIRAAQHPWEITLAAAVERYHEVLARYVEKGGEDHLALAGRLAQGGAVFAGRPLCTFLRPQFLLRPQHDLVVKAVRRFRRAVIKAKERIVADPELLDLMALSDGERRLFEINPDFKSFGVLTRLDTMLAGDDLQLVELNAEGAFGGAYSDRLTDLFEGFQPLREFCRVRRASPLYAGNALVAAVLDTWHEFGGNKVPQVALVDWKEVATRSEHELTCEIFRRLGVPARFVDPRELLFQGGVLTAGGEAIDVVYRRALTSELLGRADEVKALFDAYAARAVCVVNSFRAKVLDKKMLFAMLHDPVIQERFSPEEIEVVKKHVPWTRRVAEGKTTGPDGEEIDLLPWISDHRAGLVLKPNDEVGGRGVLLGANVEQSVWDRAIKAAVHDPSVVQRRVSLPSGMFPEVGAAGELFFSRRYVELDAYLFRGETRGLLTRLSATALWNMSAGAGTVPTFVLEDDAVA